MKYDDLVKRLRRALGGVPYRADGSSTTRKLVKDTDITEAADAIEQLQRTIDVQTVAFNEGEDRLSAEVERYNDLAVKYNSLLDSHATLLKQVRSAYERHSLGRHDDDCQICNVMLGTIRAAEALERDES